MNAPTPTKAAAPRPPRGAVVIPGQLTLWLDDFDRMTQMQVDHWHICRRCVESQHWAAVNIPAWYCNLCPNAPGLDTGFRLDT